MKTTSILKIAVLALPLVFSACKSHKKVAQPTVMTPEMIEKADSSEIRSCSWALMFQ